MSRQTVDSGTKPGGRIEKELAFGVGATSGVRRSRMETRFVALLDDLVLVSQWHYL
jgi:hypothetical protein